MPTSDPVALFGEVDAMKPRSSLKRHDFDTRGMANARARALARPRS